MAKAARKEGAAPQEVKDLRATIEWLKKEGDLIVTDKEVDPDLEIDRDPETIGWRLPDTVQ